MRPVTLIANRTYGLWEPSPLGDARRKRGGPWVGCIARPVLSPSKQGWAPTVEFAGLMRPLRFAFGVGFGLGRRRGFFFHLKLVDSENTLYLATKSHRVQTAVREAFKNFSVLFGKRLSNLNPC